MEHNDDYEKVMIPGNWTAEQADAVFQFLCHVADAIFSKYENDFCLLELEKNDNGLYQLEEHKHKQELFKDEEDIPF